MTTTHEAPFTPLVADILTAQAAFTADVTDHLVDSLTREAAEHRARLAAVRAGVTDLLSGRYLPSPDAILAALYPPQSVVDSYRQDGAA